MKLRDWKLSWRYNNTYFRRVCFDISFKMRIQNNFTAIWKVKQLTITKCIIPHNTTIHPTFSRFWLADTAGGPRPNVYIQKNRILSKCVPFPVSSGIFLLQNLIYMIYAKLKPKAWINMLIAQCLRGIAMGYKDWVSPEKISRIWISHFCEGLVSFRW